MGAHRHLTREDGQLRTASWRGDPHTVQIVATRGRPSAVAIERCAAQLAEDGIAVAVTAALAPTEQAPYLAAGFTVHERLHLLSRAVDELPRPAPATALRRGRRSDHAAILELDGRAFLPFWHLDEPGLEDAVTATPAARLRVALADDEATLVGYAITGRAGSRGYLQRLAVDPGVQRRGIGTSLVADALRWLRRWGAREVLVNTQEANETALGLYLALGFRREPEGLAVLRRELVVTGA